MEYYEIPTWKDYQHYKDRNPPWIKLHYEMLQSLTWVAMDDASRVLAIACMLIASRHDGRVPKEPAYVQRVAFLNKPPNFKPLINNGFLVDASVMQADASAMHTNAISETEAETYTEAETETDNTGTVPALTLESFLDAWNEMATAHGLPKAGKTQKRATAFKARMREAVFRDHFADAIKRIPESDFLSGRTGKWAADVEWILKPDSVQKIMEGKYDNRQAVAPVDERNRLMHELMD